MARRKKQQPQEEVPGWLFIMMGILPGIVLIVWLVFFNEEKFVPDTVLSEETITLKEEIIKNPQQPKIEFYDKLESVTEDFVEEPAQIVKTPEVNIAKIEEPPKIIEKPAEKSIEKPVEKVIEKPVEKKTVYILQVGAFPRHEDAERMRVQLAFLGIAATVYSVTVDSGTTHKVRIGPLTSKKELEKMQDLLKRNSIESVVLKNLV